MNYVGNFAARFALFAHGKATVKGKKEFRASTQPERS
jgi:hypothetical protein